MDVDNIDTMLGGGKKAPKRKAAAKPKKKAAAKPKRCPYQRTGNTVVINKKERRIYQNESTGRLYTLRIKDGVRKFVLYT